MGLPVPVSNEYVRDPAQLGREITLLSAQINMANYRLLKLIAEFDVLGGWRSGGALRSCAHWLAANCGGNAGHPLNFRYKAINSPLPTPRTGPTPSPPGLLR